jgi:hypothetical protein
MFSDEDLLRTRSTGLHPRPALVTHKSCLVLVGASFVALEDVTDTSVKHSIRKSDSINEILRSLMLNVSSTVSTAALVLESAAHSRLSRLIPSVWLVVTYVLLAPVTLEAQVRKSARDGTMHYLIYLNTMQSS